MTKNKSRKQSLPTSLGLPKLIRDHRTAARVLRLGTEDDESLRKRLRRKTIDLRSDEVVLILKTYYDAGWSTETGAIEHFKTLRGSLAGEELVKLDRLATVVLSNRLTTGRPKLIREQRNQARRISLGTQDEETLRKDLRQRTNPLSEREAAELLSRFYDSEWPSNALAVEHIKLLRGSLEGLDLKRFKTLLKDK